MAADGALHIFDIAARGLGQILPAAGAGDVTLPAGHILHDGLSAVEEDGEGKIVGLHAVDLIVGAQRNLVHVAEHVELREGDARRTLHLHAVARRHEVDGADAAGTAGLCAELRTGLAQLCRFIAEPLAGEGPLAHAGGVSLDHAHDLVELCGGQTRADRRIGGDGVGGGGVGIDAVVQIAQRAELCLEENALAVCLRLAQERRGVGDKGLDLRAEVVDPRRQLVHGIALCTVDAGEREVLPLE